ncbi:MAG: cell division protein ZipA C-terminal FtsZ-binding domain-containing protein [Janthinobacterium lividum]
MNDLQLGLIAAGIAVVVAVIGYNAWQSAKVRRRLPRSMPERDAARSNLQDAAELTADDERPFIAPMQAPRPATAPTAPVARDGGRAEVPTESRREPSFGPPSGDEAVDDRSERDSAALSAATQMAMSAEAGASDAGAAVGGSAFDVPAPATQTISAVPPALIDRRIDCVVPLRLGDAVSGERASAVTQRLRRAGSKPVFFEGRAAEHFESLRAGARYDELRVAVQLANRSGPLNEIEFSEFVSAAQGVADQLDATPEFPDMMEIVGMARELDGFAAQCDAQLSINVLSDGAPWSANYVQAIASQDGLLLSRDGTRFVKLDAKQNPVFMLLFGDTNFLRDDLTYKGGKTITLLLDVPVADEDILPFRLMCDYAASLSQRIGARVVDDQGRPLPESMLLSIEKQLLTLYAKLEQAGIPAGSAAARRLFSN